MAFNWYFDPESGELLDTDTAEGNAAFNARSQNSILPVRLGERALEVVKAGLKAVGHEGVDQVGPRAVKAERKAPKASGAKKAAPKRAAAKSAPKRSARKKS